MNMFLPILKKQDHKWYIYYILNYKFSILENILNIKQDHQFHNIQEYIYNQYLLYLSYQRMLHNNLQQLHKFYSMVNILNKQFLHYQRNHQYNDNQRHLY